MRFPVLRLDRRRAAGIALVALGAATLLFTGAEYAQGAMARDAARRAWETQLLQREVDGIQAGLRGVHLAGPPPIGAPVAQLLIPRLGLDEVEVEGVDDASLNAGPGHLPGSVLPGLPGNAVISAHRDRHFSKLGALAIGDTVITETARRRIVWRVVHRKVVHRTAPALFDTDSATLTLTTCWPIRYFGSAPDRLIITAVPLGTATVASGG